MVNLLVITFYRVYNFNLIRIIKSKYRIFFAFVNFEIIHLLRHQEGITEDASITTLFKIPPNKPTARKITLFSLPWLHETYLSTQPNHKQRGQVLNCNILSVKSKKTTHPFKIHTQQTAP